MQHKVDILVVTALDEELQYFRPHFELTPTQSETSANIYYIEKLTAHDGHCYDIALMCLNGMGNANSGSMLAYANIDLAPTYIFMAGFGGGIAKNDVVLSDIIVAEHVIYIALGKEYSDHLQTRPRTIQVDQLVLQLLHAHAFEVQDSKGYHLVFGPIAVGEQVIASDHGANAILQAHPKMVGVEMESYGVALAASQSRNGPKFVVLRAISDLADADKNDDHRQTAMTNLMDFLMSFLHSGRLPKVRANTTESPKLIAIHHISRNRRTSLRGSDVIQSSDLANFDLIENVIDQTKGFDFEKGILLDPEVAFEGQNRQIEHINSVLEEYPQSKIGYFGLAHIPLTFQLGFALNRRVINVYGNDYITGEWLKLPEQSTPLSFQVDGLPETTTNEVMDVILVMSVSHRIDIGHVLEVVSSPIAPIQIEVDHPVEGIIDSESRLNALVDAFRVARDAVLTHVPNLKRIHLFFAGPPTLAFRCGQQINPNIDPDVIVYNYARRETPRYRWAINIQQDQIIYSE